MIMVVVLGAIGMPQYAYTLDWGKLYLHLKKETDSVPRGTAVFKKVQRILVSENFQIPVHGEEKAEFKRLLQLFSRRSEFLYTSLNTKLVVANVLEEYGNIDGAVKIYTSMLESFAIQRSTDLPPLKELDGYVQYARFLIRNHRTGAKDKLAAKEMLKIANELLARALKWHITRKDNLTPLETYGLYRDLAFTYRNLGDLEQAYEYYQYADHLDKKHSLLPKEVTETWRRGIRVFLATERFSSRCHRLIRRVFRTYSQPIPN